MPSQVALALCALLVAWLFRSDLRFQKAATWAWFVPGAWLCIVGSRPLGYWFTDASVMMDAANLDGNAMNRLVQGGLMLAAVLILVRRPVRWSAFLQDNWPLLLLYGFYAASTLWSLYPAATLKRIIRDFGAVLMILVILTESDPFAAARMIFVRVAFVLFPFSVVLIKYYPDMGRLYSKSWELMYTGVTMHKNGLGVMTMVLGLFLAVDIVIRRQAPRSPVRSQALAIRYSLAAVGLWLLYMSNSKTAQVCYLLGLILLWGGRHLARIGERRHIVALCVIFLGSWTYLDSEFDVSGRVIEWMGRDRTLTGRTAIWEMLKSQKMDPMLGFGFLAFWDSEQAEIYREESETSLVSAHNGYLDAYMDGGSMAVALLLFMLSASCMKTLNDLIAGSLFGRLLFAFFALALLYNWSESSFFRLGILWHAFLLSSIRCASTTRPAGSGTS